MRIESSNLPYIIDAIGVNQRYSLVPIAFILLPYDFDWFSDKDMAKIKFVQLSGCYRIILLTEKQQTSRKINYLSKLRPTLKL